MRKRFVVLISFSLLVFLISCGGSSSSDGGIDNNSPMAQINTPAEGSSYIFGETIQFSGSGSDSEDGALSDASLVWESDVDGQICTGATCSSTALSVGIHQITLSCTDAEGAVGIDTVVITVNNNNSSPVAQISTPSEGSTFIIGDEIQFTGNCNDSEDGAIIGTSLVWESDVDGQIGNGENCSSNTLGEGTHQITLTGTDSSSAVGMDTVTITINAALPSGILPDTGQTTSYTGTHGEDSDYTINPPNYTKLDASGNELDASANNWAMVRDDVTGLIWEVKTDDGGINDKDNVYTFQDTEAIFITQLNNNNFGGHSDWRIPTIKELSLLVNTDNWLPAINTAYFPFTISSRYWSINTDNNRSDYGWVVIFDQGTVTRYRKTDSYYVRAVRGDQFPDNLIDKGDGTITDTKTGLMWQQADPGVMTWEAALTYCENLELANHDDWRLPNRNELQSLANIETYDPAIDSLLFPGASSSEYWSSTTNAQSTIHAWFMWLKNGDMYNGYFKGDSHFVRAVRGGE